MLRNAYGRKTTFYAEIAHKTKMLVRKNATAHGLDKLTKPVEFDADTLQMLQEGLPPSAGRVINLAKVLIQIGAQEGEQDPVLLSIAERAETILEAFTDRQTSTLQALDRLRLLTEERRALEEERRRTGLDSGSFAMFWLLRRENLAMPEMVTGEIVEAFKRFPNHQTTADEMRQLKAEIYKALLRVVSGRRMVDLTEQILRQKQP